MLPTCCITAELATGEPLFPGDDEHGVIKQIALVLGPHPPRLRQLLSRLGVPKHCLDCGPGQGLFAARRGRLADKLGDDGVALLCAMLKPEARERLSASACLGHRALRHRRDDPDAPSSDEAADDGGGSRDFGAVVRATADGVAFDGPSDDDGVQLARPRRGTTGCFDVTSNFGVV